MSKYRPPRDERSDASEMLTNPASDPPAGMSRPDKNMSGEARTSKMPAQTAAVVFRFLRRAVKTLGTLSIIAVRALDHALDVFVNMLAAMLSANPRPAVANLRPAVLVKALKRLLYWRSALGPNLLYVPARLKAEAGTEPVDRSGRRLPWRWERSLSRDLLGRYGLIAISAAFAIDVLSYSIPDQQGQADQTAYATQKNTVGQLPKPPAQMVPGIKSPLQILPGKSNPSFQQDTPVNDNSPYQQDTPVNDNSPYQQDTPVNDNPPYQQDTPVQK